MPFLDLRSTHAPLKEPILAAVSELIETGAFTNGAQVELFEQAFARTCGVATCVGVSSGLDALRLALAAAGVQRGDEVLVPASTFAATFEAVTQAGGRPVVVDISETDYGIDPAAAAAAVSSATSALVPVHLYGQMADMRALLAVCETHDLLLVEDACQAHGATRDGVVAGASGIAGCFSFYPGKNLGAFGDAGAIVTGDAALAELARSLREHGQRRKYEHVVEGYTARLDTIQAIVLLLKLPRLARWNEERRSLARRYDEALAGLGDLTLPPVPRGSDPVWHLYVVRTRRRDALAAFLGSRGIETGLHYPVPPHLSPAYSRLGHRRGSFPVSEQLADEALSLPLFPGMTDGQLETVTHGVTAFFDGR